MIKVYTDTKIKKLTNFWNNFHFHPTDAIEDEWGQEILNRASSDGVGNTVRMYSMFEDIVGMDENGNLTYNFTENDVRMDYMVKKGFNLLVCYNFIPPVISGNPEERSANNKRSTRYKGKMICTYPPKDYNLWQEVCYNYTKHIVERYGENVVKNWYLQCYNEPDLPSFFFNQLPQTEENSAFRLEEYKKLYENFAKGILRVSKNLKMGGPSVAVYRTFFLDFLKFVKEKNLPIDFVSIHTYGTGPYYLNKGERLIDADQNGDICLEFEDLIKQVFPSGKEIIIDEWGASTQGFLNKEDCPMLMFREDSKFSAYFGKMIKHFIDLDINVSKMMICLSGQHEMEVDFSGFRGFFTLHKIPKPIYLAYSLLSKMGGGYLVKSENDNENVSVVSEVKENGKTFVMVSYSSKNYITPLEDLNDTLSVKLADGEYTVKQTVIDKKHASAYDYLILNGENPDKFDNFELLKQIATLKTTEKTYKTQDKTLNISVNSTDNALILFEIDKK